MQNLFVQKLKQKVIDKADFETTFQQFIALTAKNQGGFLDQMKSVSPDDQIMDMITEALRQVIETTKDQDHFKYIFLKTMHNKRDHLKHGTFFVNGGTVTFFYFTDVDRGMIAYLTQGGKNGVFYFHMTAELPAKKVDAEDFSKN